MFHSHNLLFCVSKPVHVNSIHYFVAMSFLIFATTVDYLQCKRYKQVYRQVLKPSNVFVNYIDSSLCIIFSFTLTKFHKMHSILLNSLCCCSLFLSEILKQVTDQPEARDQGQQLRTDWFSLC